ncbi:hypothetical protein MICRO8M_70421 [Microbacterium sp. 8M]|nr:hypothetical protein MICRO8M_70421 [Microbacterium sp. 8M]
MSKGSIQQSFDTDRLGPFDTTVSMTFRRRPEDVSAEPRICDKTSTGPFRELSALQGPLTPIPSSPELQIHKETESP